MYINSDIQKKTIDDLLQKHARHHKERIEGGVARAAALWVKEDGNEDDFYHFCLEQFIGDQKLLEQLFERFDKIAESFDGHFTFISQTLREKIDLDIGPIAPIDKILGEYDPSLHLTDDLFANKVAFIIILNFPQYSLSEKQKLGESWDDKQWGFARMGELFISRVPAELNNRLSQVQTRAETYIAEYNIQMGLLIDREYKTLFPDDLKLITHWGLRDELKSCYGYDDRLPQQEIIYEVMKRIITQEIPTKIINNSKIKWNPYDNTVLIDGRSKTSTAEPDLRYQHIINIFGVMQKIDSFFPAYPTFIRRKFELQRELTESDVENLFRPCLESDQFAKVGRLISRKLGRNLRPFDIWYNGFKSHDVIPEAELDKKVSARYKDKDSFAGDMNNILVKLGFSKEKAAAITPFIEVDAARGAGHAWGTEMKKGMSRLRTRVPPGGMDYKGYNIAIHEFGHTVEQTISVNDVDYHMIRGVPMSACSEAFAFIFQNRDLELLGLSDAKSDENANHLMALDRYWGVCEIIGVALLEMKIWNWMYENREASAGDLKKATIEIAKEIWNKYYAAIFGTKDEIILAVYSHMVFHPLYLAEYPLGHLMEFQFEQFVKDKNIGIEMERICSIGNIIPRIWMKKALGTEISPQPILSAVTRALDAIE